MNRLPPDQAISAWCGSCEVVSHDVLGETIRRLTFLSPAIAASAEPGQFVHLRVDRGYDPLLRRPFSLHRVDREKGHVAILYRIIGRGTERLSRWAQDEEIDVMGPLGRPFHLGKPFDHALIVAGGMGIAPVVFLMEALQKLGRKITLLWGARTGETLGELDLIPRSTALELRWATEDGSKGHTGRVTDLLETFLGELPDPKGWCGFVCGPERMIAAVQRIAEQTTFPWQVSLEGRMACGVGVCQGCGIRLKGEKAYRMVCADGPVFDLKEVLLDG